MTTNGRPRINYTNKDYASLLDGMLALGRELVPEWTDQSPNDLGVMLLELFATMGDSLFYHQDRIADESYLDTAVDRRSIVQLLRLIGYELRPPSPASADLALLFKLDATKVVTVATGAEFATTADTTGTPVSFQYVRDPIPIDPTTLPRGTVDRSGKVTLLASDATIPAGVTAYRVYQRVPVIQVDAAVTGEIVGSSDGSLGQRFALARRPLIQGSLVLTVDEGGGPKAWTQVDSLLAAAGTDPSYALRRDETDTTWIELGDNRHGRAPARGRNNLVASYLVGGGAQGNVPAGAIVDGGKASLDGLTAVTNELAAGGGADAEATADAAVRGPQMFRSMGRAVTAADYEAHAKQRFGVGKALAIAPGANRIDLYIAPAGGGVPSDTLHEDLLAYFESKRVVTSIVDIKKPDYADVIIQGALTVEPRFSRKLVQKRAEDAIRALWSFDNVDFQDTLYISKIYEAIEAIDGVAGVNVSRFKRGDRPSDPDLPIDGRLTFGVSEIPSSLGIDFGANVSGGRTDD
jgi:uncharacterized phage protein gp47/JayE